MAGETYHVLEWTDGDQMLQSFPVDSSGSPVLMEEAEHKGFCCNWQGWRKYEAGGTCSGGAWSGKTWTATGTEEGVDWGYEYVPLCEDYYLEPGTIQGGDTVQCDPLDADSLQYKVGTTVIVWGDFKAYTVDITLANANISAPTESITGELTALLFRKTIDYCTCGAGAGDWSCDEVTETWVRTERIDYWDCQDAPGDLAPEELCNYETYAGGDFGEYTSYQYGRAVKCTSETDPTAPDTTGAAPGGPPSGSCGC